MSKDKSTDSALIAQYNANKDFTPGDTASKRRYYAAMRLLEARGIELPKPDRDTLMRERATSKPKPKKSTRKPSKRAKKSK